MGGKRRLAKHIIPQFPEHTTYVEPFCGGAALFFMKPPAKVEVINDINSDVVNLYRVVQHHMEEFIRQYKWSLVSREMFEWLKMQPTEPLTDIQRAARFFYLQQMSFGAKTSSRTFGTATTSPPGLNFNRIGETLSEAHLRLSRVFVENLSWEVLVKKYDRPHTLFYFDPPYWQTEGYGVEFGWDHYLRIRELADTMQGKMILSIGDHPDIRELFSGLRCQEIPLKHTVGGVKTGMKSAVELVYFNF